MTRASHLASSRARRALALAALFVAIAIWRDHESFERGNRLYRGGDPEGAAALYGRAPLPRAAYNLGTALLSLDPDSAEIFLRDGIASPDRRTAQRSLYNLGYRMLLSAQGPMTRDSAFAILEAAIESTRDALRLDPTDEDARWNLALAQRRLDAMRPPGDDMGTESSGDTDDELAINELALARSDRTNPETALQPEDPRQAETSGERQGPLQGAREAWAAQDPGPMSRAEALALLTSVSDDPQALLQGILWSHRPDVAWWAAQPYPGGTR